MAGKNEVALEFAPPPATERVNRPPDELMEMRFYIPQRIGKKRSGSREDGVASDEDGDDEGEEEEEDYDEEGNPISAAEAFHNAITTMAEIKEQAGDAIVTLPDVSVPTPRGRYDIELHADHLRLHGKTYDYKIPYKHIHRMFLLPKPDATFQQLIVRIPWSTSFTLLIRCTCLRSVWNRRCDRVRRGTPGWSCSGPTERRLISH